MCIQWTGDRIVSCESAEDNNRARSGCAGDCEHRRRDQLLQDRVRIRCPASRIIECGARTPSRLLSIASAKCSDAPPHEHDSECAVSFGDRLRWHGFASTPAVLPISTVRGAYGWFWGSCERPLQQRCGCRSCPSRFRRGAGSGHASVVRVSSWFYSACAFYEQHPSNLDPRIFDPTCPPLD